MGLRAGIFDDGIKLQEKAMRQNDEPKRNIADIVLSVVTENAEYFHAPDGTAFATITAEDGHRETWPLYSKGFERWMRKQCVTKLKYIPNTEAFNAVVSTLAANATIDGDEIIVHLRTAAVEDKIYIDLCDDKWRAIEIDGILHVRLDFGRVVPYIHWRWLCDPRVEYGRRRNAI